MSIDLTQELSKQLVKIIFKMFRFSTVLSLRTSLCGFKCRRLINKTQIKYQSHSVVVEEQNDFQQKIENWATKGLHYKYLGNGIGKMVIQHLVPRAPLGLDLMNTLVESLRYLSQRHENVQLEDEAKVIILGHTGL
jgi:hypothetical protein